MDKKNKMIHTNRKPKKARVGILIADKIGHKRKREKHFLVISVWVHRKTLQP